MLTRSKFTIWDLVGDSVPRTLQEYLSNTSTLSIYLLTTQPNVHILWFVHLWYILSISYFWLFTELHWAPLGVVNAVDMSNARTFEGAQRITRSLLWYYYEVILEPWTYCKFAVASMCYLACNTLLSIYTTLKSLNVIPLAVKLLVWQSFTFALTLYSLQQLVQVQASSPMRLTGWHCNLDDRAVLA